MVVLLVKNHQDSQLPASDAFSSQEPFKANDALVAKITEEAHQTNQNLGKVEKELLHWHYHLVVGHISG